MSNPPCMEDSTIIAKPLNPNKEHVGNTEDKVAKSSNLKGATVTFQHYANYKTKVTDKMGNQLRVGDSMIIDTLDIHMYASDGGDLRELRPALESPSSPKNLLGRVNRIGVALNLSGTDSYLACGAGTPPSLTLETHAEAPGNVDDDSGKRIIFWHSIEKNLSKFESVLHPGYYLCTHKVEKAGSLELWNMPQLLEAISEFQLWK
ncbi:uncharacterized protein LOC144791978 isoform X2 [Lissotriton helveticus]